MIKDKTIENLEKSSVRLSVTIEKDAVQNEYQDLVKKYTKTAQIKGFRKGKVPPAILEQKFGDSLKAEASMNLMENSLKELFEEIEQKPLPYSVPEVDGDPLIDMEKDFSFSVTYDVYPEITLGDYQALEVKKPQVTIGKEDLDRELETLREQNSVVAEKSDGTVTKDSIITINYHEVDEAGQEIPGTAREDFVFTVGTGYNLYKIDDDVLGMKKDEEKVIDKTYPEDFENKDLAASTRKIKVKVTAVKEKQLPALDDELAQDISDEYKTLKDLTDSIKKRLKEAADARVDEMMKDELLSSIAASSTMEIPESMIKAETEQSWHNFLQSYRIDENRMISLLESQGKSKESLMDEWKDQAVERIRRGLVTAKLLETEKIEVTDEEYEAEVLKQAEGNSATLEEIKDYINQNNLSTYIREDLSRKKLFDKLLSLSNIKKGDKIKYLDLMEKNQ
ncbi:MAG: trigger factor [Spirochaetales bacterium]|nr:trigger factor [Spirochaetales bacterium]